MFGLYDKIKTYSQMFNGTLSFQPHKQVYCEVLPFELPRKGEVAEVISKYSCNKSTWLHKLVAKPLGVFYSSEGGRITNQDWSESDHALLEQLYDSVLTKVNEWKGRPAKQLHRISPRYFGKLYALKYEGENSHFGWHYDSLGPEEYRAIFTVKQSGRKRVSFAYMRGEHQKEILRPKVGEGVLIRSGETFHAVVPDSEAAGADDEEFMQRWVLVFTYTTVENDQREYIGAVDTHFRRK